MAATSALADKTIGSPTRAAEAEAQRDRQRAVVEEHRRLVSLGNIKTNPDASYTLVAQKTGRVVEASIGPGATRQRFYKLAAGDRHQWLPLLDGFARQDLHGNDGACEGRWYGYAAVQRWDHSRGQNGDSLVRRRAYLLQLDFEALQLGLRYRDFRGRRSLRPSR